MQSMQALQEIVQLMEKPLQVLQLILCLFEVIFIKKEIVRKPDRDVDLMKLFSMVGLFYAMYIYVGYISFFLASLSILYIELSAFHEKQYKVLAIIVEISGIAILVSYIFRFLI